MPRLTVALLAERIEVLECRLVALEARAFEARASEEPIQFIPEDPDAPVQ